MKTNIFRSQRKWDHAWYKSIESQTKIKKLKWRRNGNLKWRLVHNSEINGSFPHEQDCFKLVYCNWKSTVIKCDMQLGCADGNQRSCISFEFWTNESPLNFNAWPLNGTTSAFSWILTWIITKSPFQSTNSSAPILKGNLPCVSTKNHCTSISLFQSIFKAFLLANDNISSLRFRNFCIFSILRLWSWGLLQLNISWERSVKLILTAATFKWSFENNN